MTTPQSVETLVTVNNSNTHDYVHPHDHTQPTYDMTLRFKLFLVWKQNVCNQRLKWVHTLTHTLGISCFPRPCPSDFSSWQVCNLRRCWQDNERRIIELKIPRFHMPQGTYPTCCLENALKSQISEIIKQLFEYWSRDWGVVEKPLVLRRNLAATMAIRMWR